LKESVIAQTSPNPAQPESPEATEPAPKMRLAPAGAPSQAKRPSPLVSVSKPKARMPVRTPRNVPMPPAVLIDAPASATWVEKHSAPTPPASQPVAKSDAVSPGRRVPPPPIVIIDARPLDVQSKSDPLPPAKLEAVSTSTITAVLPSEISQPEALPLAAPDRGVGLGLDPKHVLSEVLSSRHQRLIQRLHKLAFQRGHLLFNGKWMSAADARAEYRKMLVSSWLSLAEGLIVVGLLLIASGVVAVLLVALAGLGR
jgi:hypothetical protein